MAVRLTDCIAPAFYAVHWDVADGGHTYYDLYGGRGSGKSSFVGVEIPMGIMEDPQANAVVFRKVGNTIYNSVYEQIQWGIEKLGAEDLWKCTTSPYRMVYRPTGQVILFRGLDKDKKLKSIKCARGYFKFLWFEELDEYAGERELRSVQESVLRGGPKFVVFKTFNPPISQTNWANQYVMQPRRDTLRHKSCYLDMPTEWLGRQFLDDAEQLKEINPKAYEHEYMGIPTGTGGEVFENLEVREITDAEIATFGYTYQGLDFGYYPDPAQWVKVCYNPTQLTVYIFDELRAYKTGNADLWARLKAEKGVTEADDITADSAEPKSVADFRAYGSSTRGAEKGPDSVKYSIRWVQKMRKIVIDPQRCPECQKEFTMYEYDRNSDDEVISSYPDANNHCIDAVRYALNPVWRRRGL